MGVPFFRRGTTRIFVVPTIADPDLEPTAAEVNAGDEISDLIAGMDGFNFQNSPIGTPRLSTTFTTSIPGEDTADNPMLTFYELTADNDLHATLAKGTVTHLVMFYAGTAGATPAAADHAEVWKVISTGPSREYSMDNVAAKWQAKMTPDREPAFDVVLT